MDNFHTPVLLSETIDNLQVEESGKYIDGTIGGGGHAAKILETGARVLGIDQDEEAILHLKKKFESEIETGQLVLVKGNFSNIGKIAIDAGFDNVNGILLDLGVSSYQIDKSARGFSFRRDERLDMRMSLDNKLSARDLVNTLDEENLYEIFAKYGEETKAREVAREIVTRRAAGPIETTQELSRIVAQIIKNSGKINPSTRIFQALRIAVNSEIENLRKGLEGGFKLLNKGGRFEVISFHSLEDRVTKLYFLKLVTEGRGKLINKKPIIAGSEEIEKNRRSRSAKLRIFEKI